MLFSNKIEWKELLFFGLAYLSANIFDVLTFFNYDSNLLLWEKLLYSFLGIIFSFWGLIISRNEKLGKVSRYKRESKKAADFFYNWYSKEGKIKIFCTDLEWLAHQHYDGVKQTLQDKGNNVEIFLKEWDSPIVRDFLRKGVKIFKVSSSINSKHNFSMISYDNHQVIIIREKHFDNNRDELVIEVYTNNLRLFNMGLDMLDDEQLIEQIDPTTI